jgi:hypothetical protein
MFSQRARLRCAALLLVLTDRAEQGKSRVTASRFALKKRAGADTTVVESLNFDHARRP